MIHRVTYHDTNEKKPYFTDSERGRGCEERGDCYGEERERDEEWYAIKGHDSISGRAKIQSICILRNVSTIFSFNFHPVPHQIAKLLPFLCSYNAAPMNKYFVVKPFLQN